MWYCVKICFSVVSVVSCFVVVNIDVGIFVVFSDVVVILEIGVVWHGTNIILQH